MVRRIREKMAEIRRNVGGNATILLAVGLPALIGGAGLAVDTAQWYLWKRELQHAVDQAALSGAMALVDSTSAQTYQTRANQEFDANLNVTGDFATRPTIVLADYAGGDHNSVVVSASASRMLPFSGFVTGNAVRVSVTAQASFGAPTDYNACLVALGEDEDILSIGGNATVTAQCGLAALSCEEGAIQIDGSATVTTDSIATCGTAEVPDDLEDVVHEHVSGLTDQYADLATPDNSTARSYSCQTVGTGRNRSTQASLQAGTYSSIVVGCTTVFAPGIYVVDGGLLDLAANYPVTGSNVMFVLRNGAKIKLGGNGNGNSISLSPMESSDFIGTAYQAEADRYAGILVFEDRSNDLGQNQRHQLNGNSNSLIEGIIYLPANEIAVLGTADVASQCLQISAHRINVLGNANLETLCPSNSTISVGGDTGGVKLVS